MEVDIRCFNFLALRARIMQPWDREPAYSELDEHPNGGKLNGHPNGGKLNGQPNFNFVAYTAHPSVLYGYSSVS